MTGTVREVIEKSLKALEEKRVIISNSRHIIIRDSDALRIVTDWRRIGGTYREKKNL